MHLLSGHRYQSDLAPKAVKVAKSAPTLSSRKGSLLSVEESNNPFTSFPHAHQLIVTTTKGVYAWSMSGVVELFRSGSQGIVAARKISDRDGMLAVADSQLVVLHDINKGMQKSYRLKGTEVCETLLGLRCVC